MLSCEWGVGSSDDVGLEHETRLLLCTPEYDNPHDRTPIPNQAELWETHMSYSLDSLKGGYIGDYIGHYYRGY